MILEVFVMETVQSCPSISSVHCSGSGIKSCDEKILLVDVVFCVSKEEYSALQGVGHIPFIRRNIAKIRQKMCVHFLCFKIVTS